MQEEKVGERERKQKQNMEEKASFLVVQKNFIL